MNGVIAAEVLAIGVVGIVILTAISGGRTFPVLLLIGITGSILLGQILFLPDDQISELLILGQIILYSYVVRFTGLLSTPGLIGVDSWTHITQYARPIQQAGSLSPLVDIKYYFSPFYHLVVVTGSELLGISLRMSAYVIIGSVVVFSVLLLYGIAQYFIPIRWALLGTAIFAMADQFIRWGMHLIPNSLGVAFFLGIAYIVTRVFHTETRYADWVMLISLIIAITLTHQLSAFVSLVFIILSGFSQVLISNVDIRSFFGEKDNPAAVIHDSNGYEYPDRTRNNQQLWLLGVGIFHTIFTGGIWMLTPWSGESFLIRATALFWLTVQRSAGFLNLANSNADAGFSGQASQVPELAVYIDGIGFLIFLFISIVGSLALIYRHQSLQASHAIVFAITIMLIFSFVLPFFGIKFLLPGRWYVFMYALMAIVGAMGMYHLSERMPTRVVSVLFVILLLVYPSGMAMDQKATLENPTFDQVWPRYAHTESELAAMDSIGKSMPAGAAPIFTDHPYDRTFTNSGTYPAKQINVSEADNGSIPVNRTLYRPYQSSGAPIFASAGPSGVRQQVSEEVVCPPTRNRVYTNSGISLCTRRGS